MFSNSIGVKDSNEEDMIPIWEALHMFVGVYSVKIVVKNDSSNAINWVSASNRGPWRFHFF